MTWLRTWRRFAKSLIVFFLAWDVAAAVIGLAVLVFILIQGGAPSPDHMISVLGTLGVYGIIIWAVWDARKRRRRTGG